MAKLEKVVVEDSIENNSKKELPKALTSKEIAKARLEKLIEEEGKKLVKGRFRNYETPGASVEIQCRKYPENKVPFFKKKMLDNEIYEIPLYVARWLNGTDICAEALNGRINSCSFVVHGYAAQPDGSFTQSDQDEHGIPVPIFTNKYTRRYGFESLEYDN